MENTINERIAMIISSFGYKSKRSFAEKIGVAQTSLNDILNGAEPKYSTLNKILKAEPLISSEWLMRGEGEMHIKQTSNIVIPDIIYHYTSIKNMYGILSSQGFKFSSIKNSNDLREKSNESGYKSICFCMGSENDNGYDKPRMWAQYGDENKGVCIGIKREAVIRELEKLGNTDIEHFAIKYILTKDIFSIGSESKKSLMYKTKDWENENEYRFISKDCDILKITPECIAAVYIGELSNEDKNHIRSLGINDKIKPYMEQKGKGITIPLFNKYTESLEAPEDISLGNLKGKAFSKKRTENVPFEEGVKNATIYYKEAEDKETMIVDNEMDYISAKERGIKLLPEIDFKLVGGENQIFGTDTILRYWHLPECNDCDLVVQVVGNSMSPTYPPGCWVALKKYTLPNNPNAIPFGSVFGVVVRDEYTGDTHAHIKILRRYKDEETSKRYWIAHSINSTEFDDFDIEIKNVVGLWIVKQHIVSDML